MADFTWKTVYKNFDKPIALTYNPRQPHHIYVAEQGGRILVINKVTNNIEVFTDLSSFIVELDKEYDERGLLDIVFHPVHNRMYAFLSQPDNNGELTPIKDSPFKDEQNFIPYYSTLVEIQLDNNQPTTMTTLLSFPRYTKIHNGGRLGFDHCNYLYVTVGDGGPQEDPHNHAQNMKLFYGKLLRLNVDNPGRYTIPVDNPFIDDSDVLPEIYASGLRNPWSISFASNYLSHTYTDCNGITEYENNRTAWTGFIGDVGYKTREEVDIIIKGANYGWNIKEGILFTDFNKGSCCTSIVDPIYDYTTHEFPEISFYPKGSAIIGGYYTEDKGYVFSDYAGVIMSIQPNPDKHNPMWIRTHITRFPDKIRSLGRDYDDNIYLLTATNEVVMLT